MVDSTDYYSKFEHIVQQSIAIDPYLKTYKDDLLKRQYLFNEKVQWINENEGGLDKFSKSYEIYGIHYDSKSKGFYLLEWIPNVSQVFLIGEFNHWNRFSHPFDQLPFGKWKLFIPDDEQLGPLIRKGQKIKLSIHLPNGKIIDRLSVWTTFAIQNLETQLYESVYYPLTPIIPFNRNYTPKSWPKSLFIYEVHIGIASNEPKITSYTEFQGNILPRIARLGYNCIQFMAIQEHAYYGSFGYQVTNLFAASSRFGTPEEFMELINVAHDMGFICLLDIIHSHASKNSLDGFNELNGRSDMYFHGLESHLGMHPLWDSRCYNYGDTETLRLLLSNCRFWIDVYQLDGFRFDGITSMLYWHRGANYTFTGNYSEYFHDAAVDNDAVLYLMLMNKLCEGFDRPILRIAEDVSGMPLLCRPINEGGIGFHYRLALSVPDLLINLLKNYKDEAWPIEHIVSVMTNRRYLERTVAYVECHDQALVGDKSVAFWLMDFEMYFNMSKLSKLTPRIDRGLALHKMLRLLVASLAGDAYLNFIGNEFGHPEWLDFPRKENNQSYWYARRQFALVDDPLLRYSFLNEFDSAMIHLLRQHECYQDIEDYGYVSLKSDQDKVISLERAGLIFVFNFNPSISFTDYRIPLNRIKKINASFINHILDTDLARFGGHSRLISDYQYPIKRPLPTEITSTPYFQIYLPCRTAIILTAT